MLVTVVVPIVHVVACLFLIVVVLLQTGKGADMGAVFGGGGSQTLFGSTGAGNLLTKLTTAMAITFMVTSLTLAVMHQERRGSGLLERLPEATQPMPAPAVPSDAQAPAATDAPPIAGGDAADHTNADTQEDAPPAGEPIAEAPADAAADDAAPTP